MSAEKNHPSPSSQQTERLTALIAGELETAEAEALRAELEGDPELAREYRALEEAWQLFARLEPVEVRPEVEKSVLHKVRARHGAISPSASASTSTNGRRGEAESGKRALPGSLPPVSSSHSLEPQTEGEAKAGWLAWLGPVAAIAAMLMLVVGLVWKLEPSGTPQQMASQHQGSAEDAPHAQEADMAADSALAAQEAPVAERYRASEKAPAEEEVSAEARNPLGSWIARTPVAPDELNPAREFLARSPVAPDELNPSRMVAGGPVAPDELNPERMVAGGPVAPDELNPERMVAGGPVAPDELNPARIRYRTLQGIEAWSPLGEGAVALDRLNAEVAVAPQTVLELTQPESGSTIFVNGGREGAWISVVADPSAGYDASTGEPKRMMLELSDSAQVYVDLAGDEQALSVRTPSAFAELAGSAAEFEYDGGSRSTMISAARGEVAVAGFDPETQEVYDAVVRQGERATLALLRRPDVQQHLNTNWIAHWTRKAQAQRDERVELLVAEGDVVRVSSDGAIGTLVAEDPVYRNVPFVLDEVEVNVEIDEHIAETTVTEVFANTTSRTLEGTFYFPLPERAAITGFAMWVNGERVEGEWQERRRARMIYDEYRYQNLDPALLEWVEGNTFRMKVFPILPGEKKKIELRFTERLEIEGDTLRYSYPLVSEKLNSNPVRQMGINLDVRGSAPIRDAASRSHRLEATETGSRQRWQGGFEVEGYTPSRDFLFEVRLAQEESRLRSRAHRIGESGYLAAHLTPPLEVEAHEPEPGQTVFLVDTSGGMNTERYWLQLAVLDELIKRLPEDEFFTVLAYDYAPRPIFGAHGDEAFVPATEAQRRVALAALINEWRFGATNPEAALKHVWAHYLDEFEPTNVVLLGDGIATTGERRARLLAESLRNLPVGETGQPVAELGVEVRVHGIALGNRVDTEYLTALAEPFNGRVVHATADRDPAQIAEDFVTRTRLPLLRQVRLEVVDGPELFDIMPRELPALMPGESLDFAARYREPGTATVRISGKLDGEQVAWTRELALPEQAETPAARTFWASYAIQELQAMIDAGEGVREELIDDIVDGSKHYGVSSRYTSLLVLESDREFRNWNIEQVGQAVRELELDEGEPYLLLRESHGEVRVQPEGSDAWVPVSRLPGRQLPLHARVAVSPGGHAELELEDGRSIPVAASGSVHGLDLPGMRERWQQWQETLAQQREPAEAEEDPEGAPALPAPLPEPPGATPEFRERAHELARALREGDSLLRVRELAEIRQRIAADRPQAREAVAAMREHLAEVLATERAASEEDGEADDAEQFAAAREQLATLGDSLEAWVSDAQRDELLTWGVIARLLHEQGKVVRERHRGARRGYGAGGAPWQGALDGATGRETEELRDQLSPEERAGDPEMRTPTRRSPGRDGEQAGEPAVDAEPAEDRDTGQPEMAPPPVPDPSAESERRPSVEEREADEPLADPVEPAELDEVPEAGEAAGAPESVQRRRRSHDEASTDREAELRREREDARRTEARQGQPTTDERLNELLQGMRERTLGRAVQEPPGARHGVLLEGHNERLATLSRLAQTERDAMKRWAAERLLRETLGKERERFTLLPGQPARISLPSQMIRTYSGRLARELRGTLKTVGGAHDGALAHELLTNLRAEGFQPDEHSRTLLMLDTSFTMSEPLSEAQRAALAEALGGASVAELANLETKLDLARFELLHALHALNGGERFVVVLVDKHLRALRANGELVRLQPDDPALPVLRATPRTIQRVAAALATVEPDHVANLSAASELIHASSLMRQEAAAEGRTALLFTDGFASWSPDSSGYLEGTGLGDGKRLEAYRNRDWATLLERWAERQEELPVFLHTVGVGNHDVEYLETLAHYAGGRYLDTSRGHAEKGKRLAEETPAERVARNIERLKHGARNVTAWMELAEWAASPVVDDPDLAVSTFLAWASVHPSHYEIYELLGDWLLEHGKPEAALRAYSTVVEFDASDAENHRVLGNLYRALGMFEQARDQFRMARSLTRHLAIAWFHEAATEMRLGNYEAAEELLYDLIEYEADPRFETGWPERYGNVPQRAARELVLLYRLAAQEARETGETERAERWETRLAQMIEHTDLDVANLEHFAQADFVAVLDWDTDGTDVDIWVDRDGEERCYYANDETAWGGILHEDMTRGFGPEFLSVGELKPGTYLLRTHYFANHASDDKRSYAVVRLFVYPGSARQEIREYIVRLGEVRDAREIVRLVLDEEGTLTLEDRTDVAPQPGADPHRHHGDVGE